MEHVGAIYEGEWSSIMCSEEAELVAQLLGNCSLPYESNFAAAPAFWAAHEPDRSIAEAAAMYSFSQGSGFSGQESYNSTLSHHHCLTNSNNVMMAMDYSTNVMGGDDFLNPDNSTESNVNGKREGNMISHSKKRSRLPCQIPRSKKVDESDDDNHNNNNAVRSCSCCSEDESNELLGTTSCSTSKGKPNGGGKTRAARGSATDPQSLYARKRRERINERLRILQTLVPNGTKVDISTMLEEAVEYVKFLQLQIKLLSSDDLWMYAPIAYNGMDIGLDLRPQSS